MDGPWVTPYETDNEGEILLDDDNNPIVDQDKLNRYQYNGKELTQDLDLNLYAYGARYYDPAIARFTGVDPISDQFPHVSTYNYAENSPIANIDLHGLQALGFGYAMQAAQKRKQGGQPAVDKHYKAVYKANANVAAAASLLLPGPEDAVVAVVAATKFGGRILNGISKFGNKIIDSAFGSVPKGPGAKGSKRIKKAKDKSKIEESDDYIGGQFDAGEEGMMDFLAEKVIEDDGETLHLKDIAVYPENAGGNEKKISLGKM